jgi:hypothetical protein
LVNGGTTNKFTKVIVDNVFQYGGLLKSDLVSKLVSFGANEISIFQSAKRGVTSQLKEKCAS